MLNVSTERGAGVPVPLCPPRACALLKTTLHTSQYHSFLSAFADRTCTLRAVAWGAILGALFSLLSILHLPGPFRAVADCVLSHLQGCKGGPSQPHPLRAHFAGPFFFCTFQHSSETLLDRETTLQTRSKWQGEKSDKIR